MWTLIILILDSPILFMTETAPIYFSSYKSAYLVVDAACRTYTKMFIYTYKEAQVIKLSD